METNEFEIAREFADMVGSEIIEHGFSHKIIKLTAEMLMDDYGQIQQLAEEKEE